MPVETHSGSRCESRSFAARPSAFASAAFFIRRFEDGFGLCHGDAIGAAVLESNFDGENAGARLLHDVNAAFLCGDDAKFGEKEPGADNGMAGELQILLRGEDAEASERAIVSGFLDEDCFGKFISRAMICIWSSERPSPSVKTASGLPSKRLVVKTSSVK